jgi:predicted branched-subunit amino acid permease
MKMVVQRIMPVGFTLFPIGVLFGVLAAQADWNFIEVCLMSIIGFTGSGQFAFLGFANQGLQNISLLTMFLIILSMNLRYIPMSLSATQPLKTSIFIKFFLAHWLADESYASEKISDTIASRTIIRITILIFWVVSTSSGVVLASLLPDTVREALNGVTFPVSAILSALSFANIAGYVTQKDKTKMNKLSYIFLCIGIILLLQMILGMVYFWLPSIAICYFLLVISKNK